jgi:spermidine synthase
VTLSPAHSPFAGWHVLAELAGTPAEVLCDEPGLRASLTQSLVDAGASVLQVVSHRFDPAGVTVLAMLAESHASVHTWPERGRAFVDVFTCGTSADPERAVTLLAERLGTTEIHLRRLRRGDERPSPGDERLRPGDERPSPGDERLRPGGERPSPGGAVDEGARQVSEPLGPGLRRVWDVAEVLWRGRTTFQDVLIARTAHGVTLFCDDERQSSEASQLVYHEALLVPALLLAERVRDVLVIGSSEGVVCELAVAAGARRVRHVDIDAECVRACARWLPYGYSPAALAAAEHGEGPIEVRYADGWAHLREAAVTGRRYDVVVVDLPDERPDDPHAQHNRLYGEEFLRLAASVLRPGGALTAQAGCPTLWRNTTLRQSARRFAAVFPTVLHYGSDEHEWSFLTGVAGELPDPVARLVDRLPTLPYRPVTLDELALRRGSVAPYAVRNSVPRPPG